MELSSGGWPVWEGQFTPFGRELPDGSTGMHYKFTGKERDAESGLDYFGARYYGSNMGRMTSPDPSGLAYADITNPQSFNLYSYVMNNPLRFTDPSGLSCQGASGEMQSDDGDGKGCEAAGINPDGSETTHTVQATVTADLTQLPTFSDFHAFYQMWDSGVGPATLSYGQNNGWTKQIQQTPGVKDARKQYQKAGCPGTGDDPTNFASGHYAPAIHGYLESPFSGHPNYTEMQVGGYVGTMSTSGNATTFTVTNTASTSSFSGATTFGSIAAYGPTGGDGIDDNPLGPTGPEHNIVQTFSWTETGLCKP
jgi:RHS repeat-associated protein